MKNSKKICIEFAWNIVAVISCRQIAIKIVVTFKEYKPILKHHPKLYPDTRKLINIDKNCKL